MRNKINVKISNVDFDGMVEASRYAYNKYKTEVSGYLNIIQDSESGEFWAGYPSVLKQECTGATTTLDKKAIIDYCENEAQTNSDILDRLSFCWWHTHHTMKAFFSGTDRKSVV